MKLTNREKLLIVILGVVASGFLYFQFVFKPETARINELNDQYNQKTALLKQSNSSKAELKKVKDEIDLVVKEMTQKKGRLSKPIRLPDVLLELDSVASNNKLLIDNIGFDGEAGAVKGEFRAKESSSGMEDPVKAAIEEVNQANQPNTQPQPGTDTQNSAKKEEKDKLLSMTITLEFSGKYNDLINFIKYYEQHKGLYITDIMEITYTGAECSGKLSLTVYSIGKESDGFKYKSVNTNPMKSSEELMGTEGIIAPLQDNTPVIPNEIPEEIKESTEVQLLPLNIADEKAEILVPEEFNVMPDSVEKLRYKSAVEPDLILTNNDYSVNLIITYTQDTVPDEKLKAYKDTGRKQFDAAHPGTKWYNDKILDVNGKNIGVFEFLAPSEYSMVYGLRFFTEVDGRILVCSFECTEKQMEQWRPTAYDIMNSLKLIDQTSIE